MSIFLSVLPLILTLATGYGFARSGLMSRDQWTAIESLSFRILIPAMLIGSISTSDLSPARFGAFVTALVLALAVLGGLAFALRRAFGLENPIFTALFQGVVRWNAFVALAAGAQFMDASAIALLAVAIAITIPLINVVCIVVLSAYGPASMPARDIALRVVRNPLVQACAVGLVLNMTGLVLPVSVLEALDIIGRGAVGVGLLTVGAGISLRRLGRWSPALVLTVFARPLLAPFVFWVLGTAFALPPAQMFVGVLIFAVPTAANGYVIARQMGSDAELFADAMTWQIMCSMLVLPIWAAFLI